MMELTGASAQEVLKQAWQHFEYSPEDYWYPENQKPLPPFVKQLSRFYILESVARPYMYELKSLYFRNSTYRSLYIVYAHWGGSRCFTTTDFHSQKLECNEFAVFTSDFSAMMYFSHEGTMTFAGALTDQVKTILKVVQPWWNRCDPPL